jgi:hypothetical protein
MATTFPINPQVNDQYTVGSTIYRWTGYAWVKVPSSSTAIYDLTVNTLSAGSGTVYISTGSITVNGNSVLTAATLGNNVVTTLNAGTGTRISTSTGVITIWSEATLASVTKVGNTTTSTIIILNTTTSNSTNTGALTVSGGVGIGGNLYVGGTVNITNTTDATSTTTGALTVVGGIGIGGRMYSESVQIMDTVIDSTATPINNTTTTVIDMYPASQYRAAKYLIQIDSGSGLSAKFQAVELMVLVDNGGNVYATEYGSVTTNGDLGNFSADVQGDNNVRLYYTAFAATNKIVKVFRTAMTL